MVCELSVAQVVNVREFWRASKKGDIQKGVAKIITKIAVMMSKSKEKPAGSLDTPAGSVTAFFYGAWYKQRLLLGAAVA